MLFRSNHKKEFEAPVYQKIAVTLDFNENDHKVISNALIHRNAATELILIHIVESAAAVMHGQESADYETEKDKIRIEELADKMRQKGIKTKAILGFKDNVKEIVRIVEDEKADLLIIGAHGHKGIKIGRAHV